ncbi:hypothetical protein M432DRAFT_149808 [Thermoascus aurantiacus ATCC 26904]
MSGFETRFAVPTSFRMFFCLLLLSTFCLLALTTLAIFGTSVHWACLASRSSVSYSVSFHVFLHHALFFFFASLADFGSAPSSLCPALLSRSRYICSSSTLEFTVPNPVPGSGQLGTFLSTEGAPRADIFPARDSPLQCTIDNRSDQSSSHWDGRFPPLESSLSRRQ